MSFRGSPVFIVDPDTGVPIKQTPSTRIDDVGAGVTYVGKAPAGSAEGDGVWQIFRITEASGDTDIKYADGNANFDNVWSNRLSLSYS